MTKRELNINLPVQTASGIPVRIICTDRMGDLPIVGLVKREKGNGDTSIEEYLVSWSKDGNPGPYLLDPGMRLVNCPYKRKGWIKIFSGPMEEPERGNRRTTRVWFDLEKLQSYDIPHQKGTIVAVEWEE